MSHRPEAYTKLDCPENLTGAVKPPLATAARLAPSLATKWMVVLV